MAKLLIIGASRGIGRETVVQGLARGHGVRAMARDISKLRLDHPELEAVSGDALDPHDVAGAIQGVDAVINTVGLGSGVERFFRHTTFFSDSTRILVAAMEAAGPRRLIAVTGFGTADSQAALSTLEAIGYELVLGRAYADKARQEDIIRASMLDWTIVRPTILTNGRRTGRYRVLLEPASWRNGMIARADVADFLLTAVDEPSLIHHAPVLAY